MCLLFVCCMYVSVCACVCMYVWAAVSAARSLTVPARLSVKSLVTWKVIETPFSSCVCFATLVPPERHQMSLGFETTRPDAA